MRSTGEKELQDSEQTEKAENSKIAWGGEWFFQGVLPSRRFRMQEQLTTVCKA